MGASHGVAPGGKEVPAVPLQVVVWVPLTQFQVMVSPTKTLIEDGEKEKLATSTEKLVQKEEDEKKISPRNNSESRIVAFLIITLSFRFILGI